MHASFVGRWIVAAAITCCAAHGWIGRAGAQEGNGPSRGINWAVLLPAVGDRLAGKNAVLANCASCHSLENVVLGRQAAEEWYGTIGRMIDEYGAWVPEEEMDLIAEYLGAVAGEDNPLDGIPLDLNDAPEAALGRLGFLSPEQIAALTGGRPFASVEDAAARLGLDEATAAQFQTCVRVGAVP